MADPGVDLETLKRHPLNSEAEDIHNLTVWMEQQDAIVAALERIPELERENTRLVGEYDENIRMAQRAERVEKAAREAKDFLGWAESADYPLAAQRAFDILDAALADAPVSSNPAKADAEVRSVGLDLSLLRRVCTVSYELPVDEAASQVQRDLCSSELGAQLWLQLPLHLAALAAAPAEEGSEYPDNQNAIDHANESRRSLLTGEPNG